MANNTSPHILNVSATLLGFCLFVITYIHLGNFAAESLIDEFTSIIALLLIFSCLFSFISIRTTNQKREKIMELIADILFFSALFGIAFILFLLAIGFMQ